MALIEVVVIPCDSEQPVELREIEQGDFRAGQAIVGGLIEFTDIPSQKASIVSNEEGLIHGLELNTRATSLLYAAAPEHKGYNVLVGDCYVCGEPDEEGDTQSVPVHLKRMLLDQP